ncbi:hypothetical protein KFE25_007289 [Diacronema lutheri]|uniref:Uncharacterized protein n=1 Tax=Diacronema lutheri TaxID=2081491 RepID=A0A8J6CF55_DIALT|nr:hypothetical protein KFE25_007289 [Diacronema lutheri]
MAPSGRTRLFLTSAQADVLPLGPERNDRCIFDVSPIHANSRQRIVCRLESASIPITRPSIHRGNRVLSLRFGATPISYELDSPRVIGTSAELAAYLSEYFAGRGLEWSFSSDVSRLSVTNTTASIVTLLGAADGCTSAGLIGLGRQGVVVPIGATVQLPAVPDVMGGARMVLVVAEGLELGSSDSGSLLRPRSHTSNILAAVPIGVPYGGLQQYTATTGLSFPTGRATISSIDLQLLDQDGVEYNTNGSEWSAVVHFEVIG